MIFLKKVFALLCFLCVPVVTDNRLTTGSSYNCIELPINSHIFVHFENGKSIPRLASQHICYDFKFRGSAKREKLNSQSKNLKLSTDGRKVDGISEIFCFSKGFYWFSVSNEWAQLENAGNQSFSFLFEMNERIKKSIWNEESQSRNKNNKKKTVYWMCEKKN